MHKFYLTNDLGGGGTNVSRLYDYIELFNLSNIGVLLNYYYLKGHASPSFDSRLISEINRHEDIQSFVSYCRENFSAKRSTSQSFSSKTSNCDVNGFILDNGCGNFLRNSLNEGASHEEIEKIVKPFLDFAESLHFDYSVALDLAMKYTYKANEVNNNSFMSKWRQLANDNQINISLLSEALNAIKTSKYKHTILAPLHGYDYNSFSQYYDDIIRLEEKHGATFGGFALGGIANTRIMDDCLWNIPSGFKGYLKSAFLCYNLTRTIRNKTRRHIHILGAGNIYTLPFLIHAGASSSDCHSAWRRSSDGKINAKILIPLMDENFNFINSHDCLEYVKIQDIKSGDYNFNCGYSIDKIKRLLNSSDKEDFYFAEIIIFYEAMLQYNILIEFIKQNPNNYLNLLSSGPDQELNNNYNKIKSALSI